MNNKLGDMLLALILFILIALFWIYAVKATASQETTETVSVTFEPITAQLNIEPETGEVFQRTREIKVNEFTYEDAQLLMKIAQAEAGNQGTDGMWLVMSVVFNRVNNSEFPDNYHDVIYQPYQFYADGMGKTEISPECHEALARLEMGYVAPGIVAFEKTTNKSLDKYFCSAFDYRDHQFYTLKK